MKGVGPGLGALLEARGFRAPRDLLWFLPRAYEDRSQFSSVSALKAGEKATVVVKILSARKTFFRGHPGLEARAADATGTVVLRWFRAHRGLDALVRVGSELTLTGTPRFFSGRAEIAHPELHAGGRVVGASSADPAAPPGFGTDEYRFGRVVPVYTEIEGIHTRVLRKVLWNAVNRNVEDLADDLPAALRARHGLPSIGESIRQVHFPPTEATLELLAAMDTPAHHRLIYEEFFKFEYLVLRRRLRARRQKAVALAPGPAREAVADLRGALPFTLTSAQDHAVEEILADMAQAYPMNRLIQGDVGSGKTAVAFLAAGAVLAAGGQAALMAPTEILAEQHFLTALRLFADKMRVVLLTGSTSAGDRRALLARLAAGEPILAIGTHALVEDPVIFKNLDFILIDEQHRFGVEQRRALRAKGGRRGVPHALVLSATPIPRTLSLTAYGDLAVSTLREKPPGRSPVVTYAVAGARREAAYDRIRAEVRAGRQAYFIFPLVADSESEGFEHLKSAVSEAERLQREVFPDFRVGLLHGQLSSDEKAAVMAEFKRGRIHILVSTTVVEVGVDVPNATIMAVEHAERFGLSQLHQLRGRVGRGQHASYCYLFTHARVGEVSAARLDVLERTQDGFEIAEADLRLRGPGEFLGTRQSGALPFKIADLIRDRDWLLKAREDAIEILKTDPELLTPENAPLRAYFEREGKLQSERLQTS